MRQTQALALLKRSAKRRGDRAIAHLSCIVPSPENAGRTEGLDGGEREIRTRGTTETSSVSKRCPEMVSVLKANLPNRTAHAAI